MIKFVKVMLMMCITTAVFADDEARERLIVLLEASENMTAEFEQRTYKESSAKVDVTTGSLAISKPLKFNWSVQKPYEQRVVSDGETLWVFDPDLEQATYQPIASDAQQSPAMILTQPRESLTGKYRVIEAKNDAGLLYKLYPNSEDSVFTEVTMIFSGESVSEIRLIDSLNQETVILFANVLVNEKIDESVFEFVPPPGTDLFPQM